MKQFHKNPRKITIKQYNELENWLRELGDLSGVVHDLNSDEIIGGNQRGRIFDINQSQIEMVEQKEQPDEQGTVGLGFVIWEGKKYNYRQVRWTAEQCDRANIIANKAGGTWDFDMLANQFDQNTVLESGFELFELGMAPGFFETFSSPDLPEYEEPISAIRMIIEFDNAEQKKILADALGLKLKAGAIRFNFKDTKFNV